MKKFYSIGLMFAFLLIGNVSFGQEDCADGVDNDGDGMIDLNDPDCDCIGIGGGATSTASMIPNPSFEDNTCCPSGPSQLTCADDWIQASSATSDYWNFCDFDSYPGFNPVGSPLPGDGTGSGWGGFISQPGYSEMIGACLTGPMLAGTPYVLNMWIALADGNPDLTLTLYGTDDCADLPWAGFACPIGTGGWQILDDINYTMTTDGSWTEITLNFTPPVDIAAIAIGGACVENPITPGDTYNYYWIDELTIIDSVAFASGNIVETGDWCAGDLALTSSIDSVGWTVQWYLDGIALPGETAETIDVMAYGAGTYSVVYTIGAECDESSYTIVIPDAPTADFTWTDQCEDLGAITFTDASTITSGSITAWDWDFDDGGATSTATSPSYTFSGPGTYNVSLTVTSATGCTNTITFPVTVYPDPNADFEFSVNGVSSTTGLTGGCLGDPVVFSNNSTVGVPDNITITNWDFGDGSTSGLSDPTYTFGADGTYIVELAVESNNGCQDTIQIPVDVYPIPVADFTVGPVCENVDAFFTDISTVTTGAIAGWEWDFNDGSPIDLTAGPINHSYVDGTYNPSLVVFSDQGCSDTISMPLTIHPLPVADFTTVDVCNGDNSSFVDASTVPTGAIVTWSYDFGDGSPLDPSASPVYVYTDMGDYSVTLTVTSDQGCTDDTTITHTVFSVPTANFTTNDVCQEFDAAFTDVSTMTSGTITDWEWDFGDGSPTSTASTGVTHFYTTEGTYPVTLIVGAGSDNCADTLVKMITIHPMPIADLQTTDVCQDDWTTFADLSTVSTGSIDGWDWNFGQGGSSASQNPNFVYNIDGTYDVTLTVTTDMGCVDSETGSIVIHPLPVASFDFNPHDPDVEHPDVSFRNYSLNGGSYEWDFGDGTPINGEFEPSHTYPDVVGEYTVWLDVISPVGGCKDSTYKIIRVKDVLVFHVPNVFTPDGDQYNETFKPMFYSGYDPFDYHLTIFNRWGEVVFESFNAQNGWDGTYGSRGLVEDGTYVWQLEFGESMSDKKHKHRGHVTILK